MSEPARVLRPMMSEKTLSETGFSGAPAFKVAQVARTLSRASVLVFCGIVMGAVQAVLGLLAAPLGSAWAPPCSSRR